MFIRKHRTQCSVSSLFQWCFSNFFSSQSPNVKKNSQGPFLAIQAINLDNEDSVADLQLRFKRDFFDNLKEAEKSCSIFWVIFSLCEKAAFHIFLQIQSLYFEKRISDHIDGEIVKDEAVIRRAVKTRITHCLVPSTVDDSNKASQPKHVVENDPLRIPTRTPSYHNNTEDRFYGHPAFGIGHNDLHPFGSPGLFPGIGGGNLLGP